MPFCRRSNNSETGCKAILRSCSSQAAFTSTAVTEQVKFQETAVGLPNWLSEWFQTRGFGWNLVSQALI